ncbi:MAG: restriction endonuclease subunit S [Patescibacteria group bacterium]|nr:restriction endonuclease subunit S [Patescibacteria group bacterium]
MIASTIKFSQIEDRIDAEYYKPEYLDLETKLIRSVNLGNFLTKIETGNWVNKHCFSNGSIPYIKVEQVKDVFLENGEDKLNIECFKIFNNPLLDKGDILLSRVGTVGIASIFLSDTKSTFSDNVIRLKVKNLNPFYLVIFLNSEFGRSQIERLTKQAVQGVINYQSIKSIKIPALSQSFQQKIEKMVKEAQAKRKLADKKYKEAEEILNKELGLEDLDLSTQKTFEAKFSEAEDRFDPEYYQPKYKKINSKLKSQKSKLLGEIVKIRKGIEVGHEAYTTDGIPFIRVQDYDEKEIAVSGSTNYIRSYLYETLKKDHKPLPSEIIYSKDGTVGRAFVVPKDNHEFIVSGGILILIPRDVDNYYLALVLNSPVVKFQATRKSIGAIIQHLSLGEVRKLQTPILPQSTQQKISSLIQESFQLRKEAKELIQESKQKVEELIEKSK